MTFARREDAEAALVNGLGDAWKGLLLRRAITADQARNELEDAARAELARHQKVELAVSRIYAWLTRAKKSLQDLFKKIDVDGSGDFDRGEFRAGMLSIGLTFDDDTIDAIFRYMDSDGGGSVETAEFIANMESFSALMDESPSSILLNLCKHMDKTGETIKHIFARIGIGSSVSVFFK